MLMLSMMNLIVATHDGHNRKVSKSDEFCIQTEELCIEEDAFCSGRLEIIEALINAGADVNAVEDNGYSMIDVACIQVRP